MKWGDKDKDYSLRDLYQNGKELVEDFTEKVLENYNSIKEPIDNMNPLKIEAGGVITMPLLYAAHSMAFGQHYPYDVFPGHLMVAYGANQREDETYESLRELGLEPDKYDVLGQKLQRLGLGVASGSSAGSFIGMDTDKASLGVVLGWFITGMGAIVEIGYTHSKFDKEEEKKMKQLELIKDLGYLEKEKEKRIEDLSEKLLDEDPGAMEEVLDTYFEYLSQNVIEESYEDPSKVVEKLEKSQKYADEVEYEKAEEIIEGLADVAFRKAVDYQPDQIEGIDSSLGSYEKLQNLSSAGRTLADLAGKKLDD